MSALSGHAGQRRWLPYALLALPAALYLVFILAPLASTIRLSFFDWNGLTDANFTGLDNYRSLAQDPGFRAALLHNVRFLIFYTAIPVSLALLFTALLVQERPVAGLSWYRVGLFVPQVIPMVVVGVVWRWMLSPVNGVANDVRGWFGLEPLPFLGDLGTAFTSVGLVASWAQYGFAFVLFMSGVQRIDRSLYEAAALDGARAWRRFFHVTLPALRGEILVATVVSLIAAVRVFDLVFVMTRGGPANETTVVAFEIYQRAFQLRDVGGAAAAATVVVVIIAAASAVLFRVERSTR